MTSSNNNNSKELFLEPTNDTNNFGTQDEQMLLEQTMKAFDELENELKLKEKINTESLPSNAQIAYAPESAETIEIAETGYFSDKEDISKKIISESATLPYAEDADDSIQTLSTAKMQKTANLAMPYVKNEETKLTEETTVKEPLKTKRIDNTLTQANKQASNLVNNQQPNLAPNQTSEANFNPVTSAYSEYEEFLPPHSLNKKSTFKKRIMLSLLALFVVLIIVGSGSIFIYQYRLTKQNIAQELTLMEESINSLKNFVVAQEAKEVLPNEAEWPQKMTETIATKNNWQEKMETGWFFKGIYEEAIDKATEYQKLIYQNSWNLFKKNLKQIYNQAITDQATAKDIFLASLEEQDWSKIDKQISFPDLIKDDLEKWLFSQIKLTYQEPSIIEKLPYLFEFLSKYPEFNSIIKTYEQDFLVFSTKELQENFKQLQLALLNQNDELARSLIKEIKDKTENELSQESKSFLLKYIDETKETYWRILLEQIEQKIEKGQINQASRLFANLQDISKGDSSLEQKRINEIEKQLNGKTTDTEIYVGNVLSFQIKPLLLDFQAAKTSSFYRDFANHNLTPKAFLEFLETLYESNYVLVDSSSFYDWKNNTWPIKLPKGKKPVLLYLQDLQKVSDKYQPYFASAWQVENETLKFFDIKKQDVTEKTAYQILEKFIQEKPDFSFDGARASFLLENDVLTGVQAEQNSDDLFKFLASKNYSFVMSGKQLKSLNENYLQSSELLDNTLRSYKQAKANSVNTYLFSLGERAKWSKEYLNILKENNILTHLYLTDKPETKKEESFMGIGLLDLRPYTLYKDQFKQYFPSRKIYDSLVKEGHYVSPSNKRNRR